MSYIESKQALIEEFILVSHSSGSGETSYPSTQYTFDNLINGLHVMGVSGFGADFKFWLWEGENDKYHYGLVNLAAFLANAMVESIEDDTCDELSWQETSGRYAISNSCGQGGRSYQDETCGVENEKFSCEVDPDMEMTAVSHAENDPRAPPPLKCEPAGGEGSGYWDSSSGSLILNAPYSNENGRTDTEGMCATKQRQCFFRI